MTPEQKAVFDRIEQRALEQRQALEAAFVAMGKMGANADTKHPLRAAWELARRALDNSRYA